ncbi:MAG TPA: type IV toxin-antitoxin system AbiEi family antitoxin [Thermoanaerobaculia bacterium]
MNDASEHQLIAAATEALKDLGLDAAAEPASSGDRGSDGSFTLHRNGKTFQYRAEVKRRLTPSMLGLLELALAAKDDRLLIADHVTPPMADELRRRRVQFADSAGNAFLDRRGLFVFVTGRRSRAATTAPRRVRVFQPSGIKVVFALLSVPSLIGAPQRTIAKAAGVALGSVPIVLDGLTELGFLMEHKGTQKLIQRDRLLQQWTESYARLLEPTLELGRFSPASADWWRHADLTTHGAQWGGETAAALLHEYLVPERAIIYVEKIPARLMSQYRLKADVSGRVLLRRRFWQAVPAPRADVVPPLLIYADLITAGDARSIDAAKHIRDAYGL